MAESNLSMNFPKIRERLGYKLGFGRNAAAWGEEEVAAIADATTSGLRQFYHSPLLAGQDESDVHEWSFLNPTGTLRVFAKATGTLKIVPTKEGNIFTLIANESPFLQAHADEELVIEFDTSKQQFKIVEFISTERVRVEPIGFTSFDRLTRGSLASSPSLTVDFTDIFVSSSHFAEDMVGDYIVFGSNSYEIISYIFQSDTKIRVKGDASSESGAFTVERSATVNSLVATPSGGNTAVTTNEAVFVQRMVDENDAIVFTATSNSYTIPTNSSQTPTRQIVSGDATGESSTDTITIKHAVPSGDFSASVAVSTGVSIVTATGGIFTLKHLDQYILFDAKPTGQTPGNSYKINNVLNPTANESNKVVVTGDASGEVPGSAFTVVQTIGTTTGAFPFGTDSQTTITISETNFTSSMVGMKLVFDASGNGYVIGTQTSTTIVKVFGNAGGEKDQDTIHVIGADDQEVDDAFTVLSTGSKIRLSDDFGGIDGDFTFATDEGYTPIPVVNDGQLRVLQQRTRSDARPQFAAIRPLKISSEDRGLIGQRFEVEFWPAPDTAYNLGYQYHAIQNELSDANPYPLGGEIHGETILQSCLAAAEHMIDNERGNEWERYIDRLTASIAYDRRAITPEFVGYNSDTSDGIHQSRRGDHRTCDNRTVTVGGITPL